MQQNLTAIFGRIIILDGPIQHPDLIILDQKHVLKFPAEFTTVVDNQNTDQYSKNVLTNFLQFFFGKHNTKFVNLSNIAIINNRNYIHNFILLFSAYQATDQAELILNHFQQRSFGLQKEKFFIIQFTQNPFIRTVPFQNLLPYKKTFKHLLTEYYIQKHQQQLENRYGQNTSSIRTSASDQSSSNVSQTNSSISPISQTYVQNIRRYFNDSPPPLPNGLEAPQTGLGSISQTSIPPTRSESAMQISESPPTRSESPPIRSILSPQYVQQIRRYFSNSPPNTPPPTDSGNIPIAHTHGENFFTDFVDMDSIAPANQSLELDQVDPLLHE